jgi:hypothetical protein
MILENQDKTGSTNDFAASLGISEERIQQLARYMDLMVRDFGNEIRLVSSFEVFQKITGFCETTGELIYCVISHTSWHHKRGADICPPLPKSATINEAKKIAIQKSVSLINNIINEANLWSKIRNEANIALSFLKEEALHSITK